MLLPRLLTARLLTGVAATAAVVAATAAPPPHRAPEPAGVGTAVATEDTWADVVLPVDGPVTRFFVRPAERWSRGHRGVDLAADPGTAVRSAVAGVVEFAGPVAGRTVLTVRRDDGLRSSLEPLAHVVDVGTVVAAGDVIGVVAEPARAAGAAGAAPAAGHCGSTSCLHWGVRRDGDYVDPLGLLASAPVVLLPWR